MKPVKFTMNVLLIVLIFFLQLVSLNSSAQETYSYQISGREFVIPKDDLTTWGLLMAHELESTYEIEIINQSFFDGGKANLRFSIYSGARDKVYDSTTQFFEYYSELDSGCEYLKGLEGLSSIYFDKTSGGLNRTCKAKFYGDMEYIVCTDGTMCTLRGLALNQIKYELSFSIKNLESFVSIKQLVFKKFQSYLKP